MSTDTANCMCRVISVEVEVEGELAAVGFVIASFVAPGRPARLMMGRYDHATR